MRGLAIAWPTSVVTSDVCAVSTEVAMNVHGLGSSSALADLTEVAPILRSERRDSGRRSGGRRRLPRRTVLQCMQPRSGDMRETCGEGSARGSARDPVGGQAISRLKAHQRSLGLGSAYSVHRSWVETQQTEGKLQTSDFLYPEIRRLDHRWLRPAGRVGHAVKPASKPREWPHSRRGILLRRCRLLGEDVRPQRQPNEKPYREIPQSHGSTRPACVVLAVIPILSADRWSRFTGLWRGPTSDFSGRRCAPPLNRSVRRSARAAACV